ncbi:MAG TPA: phosphoglycerate kinase [Polyangiales bacterium]|nr:phosphoglycerate kinase [Polyangiales bacterium]
MASAIRSIRELPIEGRRTFLRVDFNVPVENGKVTDASRVDATLPTLRHALERGAKLVLASHAGRPKGKRKPEYSLEPVGAVLAEKLKCEVLLTDDCISDAASKVVADLREGQVALLENLRFHAGEEANDENFARELAKLADVYVNDAFGAAHRAHASVSALPKLFRERGVGFVMESEISALERLRTSDVHPFVAVLGGAKVSDKIGVLEALLDRVDALLIGGAMANTFLAAQGLSMGKSLVEPDKLALARSLLQRAQDRRVKLLLPTDLVIAPALDAESGKVVPIDGVPADAMALDIGPRTAEAFRNAILPAKALFWNGPLGLFEKKPFSEGTFAIAKAGADCAGFTVVGGGDSVAAVNQAGYSSSYDHVSTGGGASLEYLEGRPMPGIEAVRT